MNAPIDLSAAADEHYEVVDGKIVELPPMSARESAIASILDQIMGGYARANKLGRVVVETLFHLRDNYPERRPDVAFVSAGRWPLTRRVPRTNSWPVAPELAVEVVSPTNTWDEITLKLDEYVAAGVQQVWVVSTATERVNVYESPTKVRILERSDSLDAEPILPGFRLPLSQLFEQGTE